MKKIIIFIIVLSLVWFGFSVGGGDKEAQEGSKEDSAVMGERSSDVADGSYLVQSDKSKFVWTGRRILLKNYADSGTVVVSEGVIDFEEGVLSGGSFTVDLNTISAEKMAKGGGQSSLTKHLKSDAFFDVENHPESTFVITSAVSGETDSLDDGYTVVGDLTIKGITNEITFPADVYMQDEALHLDAAFSVDRSKWDIRYGSGSFFSDLGDQIIADDFEVEIKLVAGIKG